MQNKLKSVLRRSSRKSLHATNDRNTSTQVPSAQSPHHNERSNSLEERRRLSNVSTISDTPQRSRSRPVSSIYDNGPDNILAGAVHQQDSIEPGLESIKNDYRAYLPALSPIGDSQYEDYVNVRQIRQPSTTPTSRKHEEDVADRNIHRYRNSIDVSKRKPLPARPDSKLVGQDEVQGGHGTVSHKHNSDYESLSQRVNGHNLVTAAEDRKYEDKSIRATRPDEIEQVAEQLLDGFVDLRNTVDTDQDTTFAPAVTHEVVKPHEHEIIHHSIYREIHNYQYHHSIQPVYDLQILPPRHYIPDPNGDGLLEVAAEQVPFGTGAGKQWEMVQTRAPTTSRAIPRFRTEPEVIRHPTYITEEGIERKETTILYPPTLEDLSGYDGLVQPVHIDHRTGRRWLGEIVPMDKVQEQVEAFRESEGMSLEVLRESLPSVSGGDGPCW